MAVVDTLREIRERVESELAGISASAELDALRVKVLGKKGELTALLKGMGQLAPEERPVVGAQINEVRQWLTEKMDEAQSRIQAAEREAAIKAETIDVTEPRALPKVGSAHPITLVMDELIECFTGMGFDVMEGPEVELDHYNFELMNLPKNHPARDAQDTFYIDEHVKMSDLRGTLEAFAKKLYGEGTTTRFRPSFFPFTEPSAEVDMTCVACHGKGCSICKGTGWIEVLGSGMVNPKVLEMCGIDSTKYAGFAFGIGLERIAMQRYGIRDMRLLYEGDARLFGQLR